MDEPAELVVATFNIRHGRRDDDAIVLPMRLRSAAAALRADVAGFQEVDRRVRRSSWLDEPRSLASGLGAAAHRFAPATRLGRHGEYGNLLATSGTIVDDEVVHLPEHRRGEHRVAVSAVVEVRGITLRVVVTHLSTHHRSALAQLGFLCDVLDEERLPTVLMGDLNLDAATVTSTIATTGMRLAAGPPTYPRATPRDRIDHLAVRGLDVVSVTSPDIPMSDHRPLVATLRAQRG